MCIIHKGFVSRNVLENNQTESLYILYDFLMEHDLQLDEIAKAKVIEYLILLAVKFREYFQNMRADYDCIYDTFVTLIFLQHTLCTEEVE